MWCKSLPRQVCGFGQLPGALVPSKKCLFGEDNMCVVCQKAVRERAEPRGAMCPGERDEELQRPGVGSPGAEASRAGVEAGVSGRMEAPAPGLRTLPFTPLCSPSSSSSSQGFGQTLPARTEEPVEGCGGFPPTSSVCWTCRWLFLSSEALQVTWDRGSPHWSCGSSIFPAVLSAGAGCSQKAKQGHAWLLHGQPLWPLSWL